MEIWKDIEGYEGLYQVSSYGRVKSLEKIVIRGNGRPQTWKERILKTAKDSGGHLMVRLCKEGRGKSQRIHRLVADAFLGERIDDMTVHHKDHNPLNNTIENLELITKNEHDLMHSTEKKKEVYQYTLANELVKVWNSTSDAWREGGYDCSHISNCCYGIRKTHKGYRWSYKPL